MFHLESRRQLDITGSVCYIMKDQKIFELLSELECMLFYRPEKDENLQMVHKLVNEALVKFAEATGTHN